MSSTSTEAPSTLALTTFIERVHQRIGEHDRAPLSVAPAAELTDLAVAMEALEARFAAAKLAVIREIDRRDAAKDLGATGTTAWLRSGPARMRPNDASRAVWLARELDRNLHATRAALAAGHLSAEHADVIAHAIRRLPKEAEAWVRVEAERVLIGHATTFNPVELAIMAKTILDVVDPDLADRVLAQQLADEEKKAARARELSLSPDPHGDGTRLRGKLDPETTEMLKTVLDPLAAPRPKDATGERDARSYGERMGDALHEFLRQSLDRGDLVPTSGGNRPHLVITIKGRHWLTDTGYGRFLASQHPVSMQTLHRLACDAIITIIEEDTDRSDPIAVAKQRKITRQLRRTVEIRDRGCAFPGCDRPPSWTDAHHIIPWEHGGPSCLSNICLLCEYHHQLIHQQHWHVQLNPHDNLPEFIPPTRVDPEQKPLRNCRLQI